jgi:hypothetical protein
MSGPNPVPAAISELRRTLVQVAGESAALDDALRNLSLFSTNCPKLARGRLACALSLLARSVRGDGG